VAPAELSGAILVRGDALMVPRGLTRLIDDSLRRAPKGGRIDISPTFEHLVPVWPELHVTVTHEGAPPSASELASIRAPFATRAPAHVGVTLDRDPFSLTVSAAICAASGGALDIVASPGGGVRIDARFLFAPADGSSDEDLDAVASGASPRARDYARWLEANAAVSAVFADPEPQAAISAEARGPREHRGKPRQGPASAPQPVDHDSRDTT
jgi:hypothetical protein